MNTHVPNWIRSLICFLTIFACAHTVQAQGASVAAAAGSAVILDDAFKTNIKRAVDSGDYLLARALIDGMTLLDGWKKQNESLINTAFDRLNKEQREFMHKLQDLLTEAEKGIRANIEQVRQSVEEAHEIAQGTIFAKSRLVVTRYTPNIITTNGAKPVDIWIRGIGIGDEKGKSWMEIDGVKFEPFSTMNELRFSIPATHFLAKDAPGTVKATFYSEKPKFLFGKHKYSTTLVFTTVPQKFASYDLTITSKIPGREYAPRITVSHKFSGRKDVKSIAQPVVTDPLWYIDVNSITVVQNGGEASGNASIAGAPTPKGFVISAKCGEIREFKRGRIRKADGWRKCIYSWLEYKESQQTVTRKVQGSLIYGQDELIQLPEAGTAAIAGFITTAAGRRYAVTGEGQAGPAQIEILKETGMLAFRKLQLE